MTEKRFLVTYSSPLGSAPEIASEIGSELRKTGHEVDVADMKSVASLDAYGAVIMGVPIYAGFRGLGEIGTFAKTRFSNELARMPVALFAIGLMYEGMTANEEYVITNANKAIAPIVPVSTVLFAGTIDSKKLSFWQRFANIRSLPSADFQDWDAIRTWARGLPGQMKR